MVCRLAPLVLGCILCGTRLDAATLTWDANTMTAGAQDGSGTWDTTTADWLDGANDVVWPNTTDHDVLGARTAGTYTLPLGTVNAGALNFTQSGYTLTGGTLTLNPVDPSTGFTAATSGGGADTVKSTLAGTAGTRFTKTGPGTLAITSLTGGTAADPTVGIVTGGTYNATVGYFDSVLSMGFGNTFGTAPTAAAIQFLLDAGTINFTGRGSLAIGATRTTKISSAGGAVIDAGNKFDGQILDGAGSNTAFYFSNPSGAVSTFESTAIISGPGGVTLNGAGTTVFQAVNTYTGATVLNRGTLQLNGGSLGNNNLAVAPGATLNLQGGYLRFDLSISSDRLTVPGTLITGGTNFLRLGTGNLSSLTPGVYPLVTGTGSRTLAGVYQVDGGATLSVPATSQIKQFGGATLTGGTTGGTFYRLTPQPAAAGAQVVISPAPTNVINEMPLGSSITEGVSSQPSGYAGGGYRSQLYQSLVNDGRFSPNFVGSNTVLDNATPSGYNVLTGANQLHHEGHGGYTSAAILTNLNANPGTGSNGGGFWLAPNNGVNPDYVTFSVGGNDYGVDGTQTTQPIDRVDAALSYLQQLRPASNVIVANLFYRTQKTTNASGQTVLVGDLQNQFFNPLVPGVVFNHVLAGQHVSFVDQFDPVTPNNNTANIGPDGIHPLTTGYQVMAATWYNTLAFGSAYWTGAQQDGRWSTVTNGGGTNFAQNHQRTTLSQTALKSSTDVYFNNNAAPLATTLGQDLAVRSVNFAAGASGPVTIGGSNTLTIGASPTGNTFAGVGGITVQGGSGAHTITANVVLGGPQSVAVNNNQVWGNVSSNHFTVSGNVSGNYGLTLTSSYTVQAPTSATAAGTDPTAATMTQTGSGTGTFVLSGNNTYTGGTTMRRGMVIVNNASGSGTGRGPVSVEKSATLVNDGRIAGDVTVDGAIGGSGTFDGAVTVDAGGTFTGAATVGGVLKVNAGGLVDLADGTLAVRGGVVNDGIIRLECGAALAVNGTAAPAGPKQRISAPTFVNNGMLDIIAGSFSAPAGFTNNGVIIDATAVQARSVGMAWRHGK